MSFSSPLLSFFFFFFQAEDGIRDLYVTGVQTCALPILGDDRSRSTRSVDRVRERLGDREDQISERAVDQCQPGDGSEPEAPNGLLARSEERRVGKECRSRWSRDQ